MKQAKLKDLFNYLPKSKVQAGEGLVKGIYPFYTSSENQTKYLNEYQHAPRCLVFGTGGKASVHFTTSNFSTSTDCIVVKPKHEAEIDAEYFYQYLKCNIQVLENGFKGAGLKHISKAFLSEILLPYPEGIDDQRRIAYLLGKMEWLVAKRRQHMQQLDMLLKSEFLKMFGNPVRNERGWKTSTIEGFCDAVIDCPHSTPEYSGVKTGLNCIRSSDIVDGYLDLTRTYQVTEEVFRDRIARYRPQLNDIVYSREGGRLGNAARIIDREQVCLGQRMMLFKVNSDNQPEFLWALLESAQFKLKLKGLIGGGAAPRVNIKDLKKLVVAQPDPSLQLSFSRFVAKIDDLRRLYQQHLRELDDLYSALSQKAFRGELDLSMVPMPTASYEGKHTVDTVPLPAHAVEEFIHLPDTGMMPNALQFKAMREQLIVRWLEAYSTQLGNAPFVLQNFISAAQTRLDELHPDNDLVFGANDYEHIREWVFEALATGRLVQSFDEAGNSIELKVVQA